MTWYRMAANFDPNTNYDETFVIILFLQMFSNVINGLLFVSLGAFFGRISTEVINNLIKKFLPGFRRMEGRSQLASQHSSI